jgi:hypothetical protein
MVRGIASSQCEARERDTLSHRLTPNRAVGDADQPEPISCDSLVNIDRFWWRSRLITTLQGTGTVRQRLNGGYGWLQVKCHLRDRGQHPAGCHPAPARHTPIWKLEAALKCRSCKKYAPPVHMIKLMEARETTPYRWVHLGEDR